MGQCTVLTWGSSCSPHPQTVTALEGVGELVKAPSYPGELNPHPTKPWDSSGEYGKTGKGSVLIWGNLGQPRREPGSLLGSRLHLGEPNTPLKSCDSSRGCRGVDQGPVLTFPPHPADLPVGETHPRTTPGPARAHPDPSPFSAEVSPLLQPRHDPGPGPHLRTTRRDPPPRLLPGPPRSPLGTA